MTPVNRVKRALGGEDTGYLRGAGGGVISHLVCFAEDCGFCRQVNKPL